MPVIEQSPKLIAIIVKNWMPLIFGINIDAKKGTENINAKPNELYQANNLRLLFTLK